jgi:N6-adenosine-specific RNA methylase IME4
VHVAAPVTVAGAGEMGNSVDVDPDPFAGLPKRHYGAILADPPWKFMTLWGPDSGPGNRSADYPTMSIDEIKALPISDLAAKDSVIFVWGIWILVSEVIDIIRAWGFEYKTCAFCWLKANAKQLDMFQEEWPTVDIGLGYWTRANSEFCLLATRGKPKRLNADVRQGIIAPRREHSRKPDEIHQRIERLVAGPYLELFARQHRPGWDVWGNETTKFNKPKPYDGDDDFSRSIDECYREIRERKANGGPGWTPP